VALLIPRRRLLQGALAMGAAAVSAACRQPGPRWPSLDPRARGFPPGWDYPTAPGTSPPFCHGVASGDPLADRVVVWTRLTLPEQPSPRVRVHWRMARDPGLRHVVARGTVATDASRDWTVKVDVTGLDPGTTYYYGFAARGRSSPIGRTKTAPALAEGIGMAVVSCASYWSGWWNAYDRIAERDDIDVVLHCGDHVYDTVDPAEWLRARNDRFDPEYVDFRPWRNLDEARRRYALHYADPALLALHLAHPLTVAWDNHDLDGDADDPLVARQAFWEWTPCRPPGPVTALDGNLVPADVSRDHRDMRYGDVDLYVLDLRTRRDDVTILGAEQRAWFEQGLLDSAGRGAPWRVVVNPIPLAAIGLGGSLYGGWTDRPGDQQSLLRYLADNGIEDCVFVAGDAHGAFVADLPVGPGAYDPATGAGSAAVEILGNSVSRGGADETIAESAYRGLYGTSPDGDRERYEALLPQARETARSIEGALLAANPALKYAQWRDHGYGVVRLTADEATLEQWHVPILERSRDEWLGARFTVARGTNHARPAV